MFSHRILDVVVFQELPILLFFLGVIERRYCSFLTRGIPLLLELFCVLCQNLFDFESVDGGGIVETGGIQCIYDTSHFRRKNDPRMIPYMRCVENLKPDGEGTNRESGFHAGRCRRNDENVVQHSREAPAHTMHDDDDRGFPVPSMKFIVKTTNDGGDRVVFP